MFADLTCYTSKGLERRVTFSSLFKNSEPIDAACLVIKDGLVKGLGGASDIGKLDRR